VGVRGRFGNAPVVLPANVRHAMVLSCYVGSYWRLSGEVDGHAECCRRAHCRLLDAVIARRTMNTKRAWSYRLWGRGGLGNGGWEWSRYPSVRHVGRTLGLLLPI
jgi:hypothetical protein